MAGAPKFRLTAPEPLERGGLDVAFAIALDTLLLPPAQWICLGIGTVELTPAQIAAFIRVGAHKPGWPDIQIGYELRTYGIEIKRIGGELSKTQIYRTKRGKLRQRIGQEEMFPRLLAANFTAIEVAHSVDDLLRWLDVWGIPHRGRV